MPPAPPEIKHIGIFAAACALFLFLLACFGVLRGEYKAGLPHILKRKITRSRRKHPIVFRLALVFVVIAALAMMAIAIFELVGPLGPFSLSR